MNNAQLADDPESGIKRYLHRLLKISIVALFSPAVLLSGCNAQQGSPPTWALHVIDESLTGADGVDLFDVDGDGDRDAVVAWEESAALRLYLNPGPAAVRRPWPATAIEGGLDVGKIEDALFADLNGDGTLDAVFSAAEKGREKIGGHWLQGAPGRAESWRGRWLENGPAYRYIKLAIGDIDGAGDRDLVAGAKSDGKPGMLVWYAAPALRGAEGARQWQGRVIDELEWVDSLAIHDIDGDGARDILVNHWDFLAWYRNPGAGDGAWQREQISDSTKAYFARCPGSDAVRLVVGADLSAHGPGDTVVYLVEQQPGGGWSQREVRSIQGVPRERGSDDYQIKGLACGALDADPRPDIAVSISGRGAGLFAVFNLDVDTLAPVKLRSIAGTDRNSLKGIKYDDVALDDVDGDGDLDIVTTEENGRGHGALGRFGSAGMGVIWYENPFK